MNRRLFLSSHARYPFSLPISSTKPIFIIPESFHSNTQNVVSLITSNLKNTPTSLKNLKKQDKVHRLGPAEIDAVLLRCQSNPVLALGFFDWVRNDWCMKPTSRNYCTVVHILTWSRMFTEATRLLGEVVETGDQVFDDMVETTNGCNWNPIAFDLLVKAYVQLGLVQVGIEVIGKVVAIGLTPGVNACNYLLNGLLKSDSGEMQNKCWEIYEEMKRIGVSPNRYTFNILTHALCKVGNLNKVEELFEKMEDFGFDADVVTYNTLIHSYCKKKKMDLAFYLYKIMYRRSVVPDLVTYTTLIKGLCIEGRVKEAHQLFHTMFNRGISPDRVTYNSLISCYSKEGKLQESKSLLHEMVQIGLMPDKFTCIVLVDGYIKAGRLLTALNLVVEIQRLGVSVHDDISIKLIGALCLEGRPNAAKKLFRRTFHRPTLKVYNALIEAFCKDGDLEEALSLKDEIIAGGDLQPDLTTYGFLVEGLCQQGKSAQGEDLVQEMYHKFGLIPDSSICSAMINGYCKEGNINKVEGLLEDFVVKFQLSDSNNYNSLIELYCKKGSIKKAFGMRDRMMKLGAVPDAQTCKLLISALSGRLG